MDTCWERQHFKEHFRKDRHLSIFLDRYMKPNVCLKYRKKKQTNQYEIWNVIECQPWVKGHLKVHKHFGRCLLIYGRNFVGIRVRRDLTIFLFFLGGVNVLSFIILAMDRSLLWNADGRREGRTQVGNTCPDGLFDCMYPSVLSLSSRSWSQ